MRRIQSPFLDLVTKDIVFAYFFDATHNALGKMEEPPTVVTIPAHVSDLVGGKGSKDAQTGNWTQADFPKRFQVAAT